MRILILRGGALGDFLVTLPALRALRAHWPQAELELVGNASAAELAVRSGLLDRVHSQHAARWAPLHAQAPLPDSLREWLNAFDVIISFWPDADGVTRRHLEALRGKFVRSDAAVTTSPAAKHFADGLAELGIIVGSYDSRLDLENKTRGRPAELPADIGPYVAIHAGSGSPAKNWPFENWVRLVRQMKKPIVAVSGEADLELPSWPKDLGVVALHALPLPSLAAVLRNAEIYVGHDTGVSHLAAAVGTRAVLFFGPTAPHIWAPPSLNVRIIKRGPSLADIKVEDALAGLRAFCRT